MEAIKDLICSFIRAISGNDPYYKKIASLRMVMRRRTGIVKAFLTLYNQCRWFRRAHYKRIQRGSVKGTWFAKNASSRTEESIAGTSGPVILFIHGGAFISGNTKMWSDWSIDIIDHHEKHFKKDLSLFFVDYTLAPEQAFPRQWHESRTALDYLTRSMSIHPSRIFIAGDSAGANLALQTLFELESSKSLAGGLLFSPWAAPGQSLALMNLVKDTQDLKMDNANASWVVNQQKDYITDAYGNQGVLAYVGKTMTYEEAYVSPQINPVLRKPEEFKSLPSLLFVYGGGERLRDQILEFVDLAKQHAEDVDQIEGENACHDYALAEDLCPEKAVYLRALEHVSSWVEKKMIHA